MKLKLLSGAWSDFDREKYGGYLEDRILTNKETDLATGLFPSIDKFSATAVGELLAVLVVIDVHHLVPLGGAWICVIVLEQVLHDLSTGVVVSLKFAHDGW